MRLNTYRWLRPNALLATLALASVGGGVAAASTTAPVRLADSHIIAHLNWKAGETPENIVAAPHGAVDVTFAAARQVDAISAAGRVTVLATLPAPPKSAKTPALGFPLTVGLQKVGNTLYALYATGDSSTTGLWRLRSGQTPARIAALPANGLPNGMTFDQATHSFYVADSINGVIDQIPLGGGRASVFAKSPAFRRTKFLGVNGVRLHDGALWASNFDLGTVLRVSLSGSGTQHRVHTVASGLKGIDDFGFAPGGKGVLAAIDPASEVDLINRAGSHRVLLSAKDGLSNPTAVLVRGNTVDVTSAAYVTQRDPNLLVAQLKK